MCSSFKVFSDQFRQAGIFAPDVLSLILGDFVKISLREKYACVSDKIIKRN